MRAPDDASLDFAKAVFDAQCKGVAVVASFMHEAVTPVVSSVTQLSDGSSLSAHEVDVVGLYYRSLCTALTVAKLDDARDFQGILGCCRTQLETVVDLVLLCADGEGASAQMRAWEESYNLKIAETAIAYFDRNGIPVPPEYVPRKTYIDNEGERIRAARVSAWGDEKHRPRWTCRDLLGDCRHADRLRNVGLEEFYETEYRRLCSYVHGSGLMGIRSVPARLFWSQAALALGHIAEHSFVATELVVEAVLRNATEVQSALRRARKTYIEVVGRAIPPREQ